MGTKPSGRKIVYRRVGPSPFEVVGELDVVAYDDLRFFECAKGRHDTCEGFHVAPILVCACTCHAVEIANGD